MAAVLVTGANRGLGLEFVSQYAAGGARVFACCREPKKAGELNGLAKANLQITVQALDVARGDSIDALAREMNGEPLDILINNAPGSNCNRKTGPRKFALVEETGRA